MQAPPISATFRPIVVLPLFASFKNISRQILPSRFRTPVLRGVSKGVEDGCRLPSLWVGHPWNSHKAVLGVACPQDPGET
jgi:hypothetical protein